MTAEVITQLLKRRCICAAEYDSCFNVVFLTTHFKDNETGNPVEMILDNSGDEVVSVVGRVSCSQNKIDNQTILLHTLWLINRINEQINESEWIGGWFLDNATGNYIYTASCPRDASSVESLTSFCSNAIQTYIATRHNIFSKLN